MKKNNLLSPLLPSLFLCCMGAFSGNATNYYADPSAAGSMSNPGSFAAPWANLSSIFAANKSFVAGDTIFLRTGNHGYAIIRGINTGYVVIAPQPGEQPVIERVRVSASTTITAAYWKLQNLTIRSESANMTPSPSYYLVEIYPFASNITISGCTITSNPNTTGWTRDDWRNRCNNGLFTRGRLNAQHIIENNLIENTAFGLTIASSNTLVRGNIVHNFTNDGSRVLGSDILFEKNSVSDLIKVMTTAENHDDLFQAFTYASGGAGQDTLKNNIIRGNILINTTDTTRQFRGNAQGIGCFDGVFLNWSIENNIVLTDHWHGISMYGAVNCKIVNNTVLDPYLYSPVDPFENNGTNIGPTWIRIDKKTNGPASVGNIVQNNLVASPVIIVAPTMGSASHNISMGALPNLSNYFMDVTNFAQPALFDLHLKPGAAAIDAGDPTGAPSTDYDGIARPQGAGFDIGAYEFVGASGTTDLAKDEAIHIYPNPSSGIFTIELGAQDHASSCHITIYNSLGKRVCRSVATDPASSHLLDLSHASPGVYFIWIERGGKRYERKIFVE